MIEDIADINKKYNPSKNITNNILSKYERVKILGMRAEQLQRGAQPLVDISKFRDISPLNIAKRELEERKLPFIICRTLPNGLSEYWKLDDMIII
jgi:DNA-directed RNA polymerase I, II, and III subunit RPABC2